jgi:hypothetical protein
MELGSQENASGRSSSLCDTTSTSRLHCQIHGSSSTVQDVRGNSDQLNRFPIQMTFSFPNPKCL